MTESAIFGAGCFWHVEEAFRKVNGVLKTTAGYSGGDVKDPTYEEVCSGRTHHAEVVLVEFDPAQVSYDELLEVFWMEHDPTTRNRQGPDVGEQYRSVIFYRDDAQKAEAAASRDRLQGTERFKTKKIVTQILPAQEFYPAEEYHQRYVEKHAGRACRMS